MLRNSCRQWPVVDNKNSAQHLENKNMKFQKLLLASAIGVAMSSSAFAMESMTDDSMSSVTGQDGLTVSIQTPAAGLSFQTNVYDSNGFGAGNLSPGVIVIGSTTKSSINTGTSAITLTIDAGAPSLGGAPTLNIAVGIPNNTVIHTGDIKVASTVTTAAFSALTATSATLLNDMTITLGATTLNIQLGAQPQGAMIAMNTTMTGGLNIANFALNDTVGGSSISVGNINLTDMSGANLTVVASVAAKPAGLVITTTTLGTAGTAAGSGLDTQLTAVKLGGAPAIGNVEILGLNLNGSVITIAGH
jgi:hypothetical protein